MSSFSEKCHPLGFLQKPTLVPSYSSPRPSTEPCRSPSDVENARQVERGRRSCKKNSRQNSPCRRDFRFPFFFSFARMRERKALAPPCFSDGAPPLTRIRTTYLGLRVYLIFLVGLALWSERGQAGRKRKKRGLRRRRDKLKRKKRARVFFEQNEEK